MSTYVKRLGSGFLWQLHKCKHSLYWLAVCPNMKRFKSQVGMKVLQQFFAAG